MAELTSLIVNGVDIEEQISELNTNINYGNDFIKAVISSNYTIDTKNVYLTLPLVSGGIQGSTFECNSDGTITVTRNCTIVIVAQAYYASGFSVGDWVCTSITIDGSHVSRGGAVINLTSPYQTVGSNYIGYVTAGTIISMRVLNENAARGIIGSTSDATFMRLGVLR